MHILVVALGFQAVPCASEFCNDLPRESALHDIRWAQHLKRVVGKMTPSQSHLHALRAPFNVCMLPQFLVQQGYNTSSMRSA